jgi:hypothetical protein
VFDVERFVLEHLEALAALHKEAAGGRRRAK